jgi:hypothetical protein
VERVLALFHKHFAGVGFDGVFLDKIRYPSFVSGLAGGVSCFCPHCLEAYAREGLDAERLRRLTAEVAKLHTPFGVTAYRDGKYAFADELWGAFFAIKSRIVRRSVGAVAVALRGQGYQIGLDVFAPFMSTFVGQDIPAMAEGCAFVKPMMYRATYAPAGLPFELDAMLKATGNIGAAYAELLCFDPRCAPFDLEFTVRELANLADACACPVYAGFEVNRQPGVADATPGYVRETFAAVGGAGCEGVVLSWNLLDAPMENILAIVKQSELQA